jgi:hypothetical protein
MYYSMPINMFFIVKNHWEPSFTDNPRIKCKNVKYSDKWAFVSLYDGLGGPPIFCGLLVDQRRVDRAVGSGGLFLNLLLFLSLLFG